MIRDIFFEVPTPKAADELTQLCLAEGWTVDPAHHYEEDVPYGVGDDTIPPYTPNHTYVSLTAHMADFDYDQIEAVGAKSDELAKKVGGMCTGGGCAIGPGDYRERESLIEWVEDAQPILDIIGAPVIDTPLVSIGDMAMQIRERLLATGWTPPPRVFLEGDSIPSHLPVIDHHGEVDSDYQEFDDGDGEVYTANYDVVEMNIDYAAAVARERKHRGVVNPRAHLADEV